MEGNESLNDRLRPGAENGHVISHGLASVSKCQNLRTKSVIFYGLISFILLFYKYSKSLKKDKGNEMKGERALHLGIEE